MPDMLEDEYAPHYTAWKADPSRGNADRLLTAVRPVLDSAIRTYGGNAGPTLQSRAKLMALNAMKRYDPARAKLRTHLMTQLQGLRRHAVQERQIVSVPERVALAAGHLREAENELRDRLGREPSTLELADHTGLSPKRIAHVRKIQPGLSEGILSQLTDEGEEGFQPAVEADHGAWHEFVYHGLHPTDQVIMEHSLGMHGRKALPKLEIARKLRLSPGAVSQRAAKIQTMLDQRDELGGLL